MNYSSETYDHALKSSVFQAL